MAQVNNWRTLVNVIDKIQVLTCSNNALKCSPLMHYVVQIQLFTISHFNSLLHKLNGNYELYLQNSGLSYSKWHLFIKNRLMICDPDRLLMQWLFYYVNARNFGSIISWRNTCYRPGHDFSIVCLSNQNGRLYHLNKLTLRSKKMKNTYYLDFF